MTAETGSAGGVRPPGLRARLRLLRFGLSTVLGLGRRGVFIPYRYAATLPETVAPYDALAARFAARQPDFEEMLDRIDGLSGDLDRIGEDAPPSPRWRQGWFPGLDAECAYALVRTRQPQRIVEIGSGHSTRFLARAIADGGLQTSLTAIDPAPRATLDGLAVDWLKMPLHDAPPALFAGLQPGDILFVDSSHILIPGSDVDIVLNRIWPVLPPGVLVHFHDILLPDGYPAAWAWRGYNEQQGVGVLIASGAADIVFSSHYVRSRMAAALEARRAGRRAMFPGAIETSLWLEKRAPPG